jgi:hypothetical protein
MEILEEMGIVTMLEDRKLETFIEIVMLADRDPVQVWCKLAMTAPPERMRDLAMEWNYLPKKFNIENYAHIVKKIFTENNKNGKKIAERLAKVIRQIVPNIENKKSPVELLVLYKKCSEFLGEDIKNIILSHDMIRLLIMILFGHDALVKRALSAIYIQNGGSSSSSSDPLNHPTVGPSSNRVVGSLGNDGGDNGAAMTMNQATDMLTAALAGDRDLSAKTAAWTAKSVATRIHKSEVARKRAFEDALKAVRIPDKAPKDVWPEFKTVLMTVIALAAIAVAIYWVAWQVMLIDDIDEAMRLGLEKVWHPGKLVEGQELKGDAAIEYNRSLAVYNENKGWWFDLKRTATKIFSTSSEDIQEGARWGTEQVASVATGAANAGAAVAIGMSLGVIGVFIPFFAWSGIYTTAFLLIMNSAFYAFASLAAANETREAEERAERAGYVAESGEREKNGVASLKLQAAIGPALVVFAERLREQLQEETREDSTQMIVQQAQIQQQQQPPQQPEAGGQSESRNVVAVAGDGSEQRRMAVTTIVQLQARAIAEAKMNKSIKKYLMGLARAETEGIKRAEMSEDSMLCDVCKTALRNGKTLDYISDNCKIKGDENCGKKMIQRFLHRLISRLQPLTEHVFTLPDSETSFDTIDEFAEYAKEEVKRRRLQGQEGGRGGGEWGQRLQTEKAAEFVTIFYPIMEAMAWLILYESGNFPIDLVGGNFAEKLDTYINQMYSTVKMTSVFGGTMSIFTGGGPGLGSIMKMGFALSGIGQHLAGLVFGFLTWWWSLKRNVTANLDVETKYLILAFINLFIKHVNSMNCPAYNDWNISRKDFNAATGDLTSKLDTTTIWTKVFGTNAIPGLLAVRVEEEKKKIMQERDKGLSTFTGAEENIDADQWLKKNNVEYGQKRASLCSLVNQHFELLTKNLEPTSSPTPIVVYTPRRVLDGRSAPQQITASTPASSASAPQQITAAAAAAAPTAAPPAGSGLASASAQAQGTDSGSASLPVITGYGMGGGYLKRRVKSKRLRRNKKSVKRRNKKSVKRRNKKSVKRRNKKRSRRN